MISKLLVPKGSTVPPLSSLSASLSFLILSSLTPALLLSTSGNLLAFCWFPSALEKSLILGRIEDNRRREGQRVRWLGSITSSKDLSLSKFQEIVKNREAWCAAVMGLQSLTGLSI